MCGLFGGSVEIMYVCGRLGYKLLTQGFHAISVCLHVVYYVLSKVKDHALVVQNGIVSVHGYIMHNICATVKAIYTVYNAICIVCFIYFVVVNYKMVQSWYDRIVEANVSVYGFLTA